MKEMENARERQQYVAEQAKLKLEEANLKRLSFYRKKNLKSGIEEQLKEKSEIRARSRS